MLHSKPYFLFIALLAACSPRPAQETSLVPVDSLQKLHPISEVLAAHTDAWMKIEGVTGTGETQKDGKPAILIFVDSLTDRLRAQLPSIVEGYPVVIQTTGTIKADHN